jgi:hypothetical protein
MATASMEALAPMEMGERIAPRLKILVRPHFQPHCQDVINMTALLKARISKLEGALQAAHARMTEDCRASGIDASMSLSSPTSGSPLPWTPTNGTLRLPELGTTPGDLSEDERLDSVSEEPVTRSTYCSCYTEGIKGIRS